MDQPFSKQGAEAKLTSCLFYERPCLIKKRFSKKYHHAILDKSLSTHRMKSEIRAMLRCKLNGICVPSVYMVDMDTKSIYMEYVSPSVTVQQYITHQQEHNTSDRDSVLNELATKIGQMLGQAHQANVIHGDLTTSNMLLSPLSKTLSQDKDIDVHLMKIKDLKVTLIDFGLTSLEGTAEDKGVDLYVLERALLSTHPNTHLLFKTILSVYQKNNAKGAPEVIRKLEEIRLRGRKRTMIG